MAVDRLVEREARDAPCRTHEIPLGQAIESSELPRVEGVREEAYAPLAARYGHAAHDVLAHRRAARRAGPAGRRGPARPAGRGRPRGAARAGADGRRRAAAPHPPGARRGPRRGRARRRGRAPRGGCHGAGDRAGTMPPRRPPRPPSPTRRAPRASSPADRDWFFHESALEARPGRLRKTCLWTTSGAHRNFHGRSGFPETIAAVSLRPLRGAAPPPMRRRLAFIVTTIAALAAVPGVAQRRVLRRASRSTVPAPTSARSATSTSRATAPGAVAYVRRDGGVDHVFVSRLVDGAWQAPERVDAGLDAPAATPAVAASDGGRAGGRVHQRRHRVRRRAPGRRPGLGRAAAAGPGAADPSVDMSFNGAAYATFTGQRRRRAPPAGPHGDRLRRHSGARWTPTRRRSPASAAGRSRVAIAADGTGVAVWGEAGHVFARPLFGTNPSSVVQDLTLADARRPRRAASPTRPSSTSRTTRPSPGSASASSSATAAPPSRGRSASGCAARASEPPVAFDGLGWGGQGVEPPAVDLNGKAPGHRDGRDDGVAPRSPACSRTTSSTRRACSAARARPRSRSARSPRPPTASSAGSAAADGTVHGASTTTRPHRASSPARARHGC